MSDPIADIILQALIDNNEALLNNVIPDSSIVPEAAKQIRQQIGRELIRKSSEGAVLVEDVYKACQMEVQSE